MADILFLGIGGGRVNLLRQRRGTGGFLILGKNSAIHVDPGPGALFRLLEHGQNPLSTDAVIVTHAHIDHVHDSPLIIEGMTDFMLKKRGALIASAWTLEGDDNGDRSISKYHQSMVEKIIVFKPGQKEEIEIAGKNGSAKFTLAGTPVHHDDKSGFGFVMDIDGAKIGYTSDTEYFDGLAKHFAGCDVLIANNIKSADDPYPGHLNSATCAKLFSQAMPKFGIITHLGMKILLASPEAEAQKIEKASGVKTYAAREGYYFCTDRCGWFRPEKQKQDKGQKTLSD